MIVSWIVDWPCLLKIDQKEAGNLGDLDRSQPLFRPSNPLTMDPTGIGRLKLSFAAACLPHPDKVS